MSETDDTFAGTSARSTKHSPREDDELKHELEGIHRTVQETTVHNGVGPSPDTLLAGQGAGDALLRP